MKRSCRSIWMMDVFFLIIITFCMLIWDVYNNSNLTYYKSEIEPPTIETTVKYVSSPWLIVLSLHIIVRLVLIVVNHYKAHSITSVIYEAYSVSFLAIELILVIGGIIVRSSPLTLGKVAIVISLNEPFVHNVAVLLLSFVILFMYLMCKDNKLLYIFIAILFASELIYVLSYLYINCVVESAHLQNLICKLSGISIIIINVVLCIMCNLKFREEKNGIWPPSVHSNDKNRMNGLFVISLSWMMWAFTMYYFDIRRTNEILIRSGWDSDLLIDGAMQAVISLAFTIYSVIKFFINRKKNGNSILLLWWYCFALNIMNNLSLSNDTSYIAVTDYHIHSVNPNALLNVSSIILCSLLTIKSPSCSLSKKHKNLSCALVFVSSVSLFFLQWAGMDSTCLYCYGYQWIFQFFPPSLILMITFVTHKNWRTG